MAERHGPGIGAEIMGAGKFGPPGWQDNPEWRGWWGDNPPFHTPTYVLTHRPRPPLEMEGGTTFHFLDAAPAHALAVAREVADGQDVRIGGRPDDAPRVPCRRARRPSACRPGSDPPRSRGSVVGRSGGTGAAVRCGGGLDAERGHPSHLHAMRIGAHRGARAGGRGSEPGSGAARDARRAVLAPPRRGRVAAARRVGSGEIVGIGDDLRRRVMHHPGRPQQQRDHRHGRCWPLPRSCAVRRVVGARVVLGPGRAGGRAESPPEVRKPADRAAVAVLDDVRSSRA